MDSTLSKARDRINKSEQLSTNRLNSLSIKVVMAVTLTLLISAPITRLLNSLVQDLTGVEGNLEVYLNTFINILLINLMLYLFMRYMLIRPLNQHIKRLHAISNGNFKDSDEVKGSGEFSALSSATEKTVTNLNELINEVQVNSKKTATVAHHLASNLDMIKNSSKEITKTIEEIAGGASDQAISTEKGTLEIIKLGELIEKDNHYMEQLNKDFQNVLKIVETGLLQMEKLTDINESTNQAIEEVKAGIIETNKSANHIQNASNVISDIAEQTNLLALNAAIEAARAGETGKGFAVVADEIRKLAEKSSSSTKDIHSTVNNLQKNSANMVSSMDKVIEVSTEQSDGVANSQKQFSSILSSIEISKRVFANLNDSAIEMQKMKESIVEIMQQLSAISEENSASTEETMAQIEEQNEAIEALNHAGGEMTDSASKINSALSKFEL